MSPSNLQGVKTYLEGKSVVAESAGVEYVAKDCIEPTGEDAEKIEKLLSAMEDNQDISEYYSNLK
jgi:transcriptional/translational regulatory protein YebC/TACO1